jgi:hypothetical protein
MQLTDFYFFIVPLVVLLMLLIPVILYYARKEEQGSKELERLKEEAKHASPILKGPKAIEYLETFIIEMEENEAEETTEKQAEVMIKVAQVLISTINKEKPLLAKLMHTDLIPKLKVAMEKLIQQISASDERDADEKNADFESEVLYKPKRVKTL